MKKILLVNDCRFESMIMKDMLTDIGYEVHITDEYDALIKIRELSPNVLICNLVMKETKGNLIIEKVKRVFPHIKCFLSSSSDVNQKDYLKYEVDGIIKTPVNYDRLSEILNYNRATKAKEHVGMNNNEIKASPMPQVSEIVSKIQNTIDSKLKRFNYCPYCGENIGEFGGSISFCPFCGGKIS